MRVCTQVITGIQHPLSCPRRTASAHTSTCTSAHLPKHNHKLGPSSLKWDQTGKPRWPISSKKNSFKLGDSRIWHSHNIYINLEFVVCICLQFFHFWKPFMYTFFYLCFLGGNLSEIWLCYGGWSTRDQVRPFQLLFNCISEIFFLSTCCTLLKQ